MSTKRALLVVLIAGAAILALKISIGAAQTSWSTATWDFQGRVYEGDVGKEPPNSQPLEGVVVSVYGGANPYPDPGAFLLSTTTNSQGWYGLNAPDGYEYYHIIETDPPGYYSSAGATSVSGTAKTSNWIQYDTLQAPLSAQTLTGNKFWDKHWDVLFEDDFEDGVADGWDLEEGWGVIEDAGRQVLSGSDHFWAVPLIEGWVDYELTTTVKLISGTVHLNVRFYQERVNETDTLQKRYYVGLKENRLYVKKQIGTESFDLYLDEDAPLQLDTWHTVRVRVEGTAIKVYVDDVPVADLTDEDNPVMFGGFAIETLDHSHAYFDDIRVLGPIFSFVPGYVWTRMGGPSGGLGYDVRIRAGDKMTMYVTDNPSGVNKSYDGGNTWVQRNISITTRTGPSKDEIPIFSLTIDPSDPDILWAGTQDAKGIYRSVDGGETWEKRDNGVVEGDEISFRGFGVHPTNSNIVFGGAEIRTVRMGQEFVKTRGVIYKTTNGGLNWSPVLYTDNLVRFILFDYTNPLTMYASIGIFDREAWEDLPDQGVSQGVLKSTNGGNAWFEINNGIPMTLGNRFVGYLEMHPANPQILFAASGNNAWGKGGIFRTTDGGLNWTKVLSDDIFTLVIVSPADPDVVYAGSGFAMYRSDQGGDPGTWQKFWKPTEWAWGPPGIRAGVPIGAVADPDDPMTIFANNYQGGNFKSTDGGQTWVNASKGYSGAQLTGIAINRSFPAVVYVVGRSGPHRSINGGEDWSGLAYSPASYPEWYGAAVNPAKPNEILIADEFSGVILKSTDSGMSWRRVFTHPVSSDTSVCTQGPKYCNDGFKAIEYAPSNPNVVYAGMCAERRTIIGYYNVIRSSHGMYKSTDGGEHWVAITKTLPMATNLNIHDIAVHPTDPNTVYIGTWKNGLYKTSDGGQNWTPMNTSLTSLDVRSVAIDPNNPQVVYAGLGGGKGVFKSTTGGTSWTAVNSGLNVVCPSYLQSIGQVEQGVSLEKLPNPALTGMSGSYGSSMPWTSIWAIAIDPTNSQVIYAADHHSGVYLSTTGGGNWMPINTGLTMRAVTRLEISSDGQVVYAATWGGGVFRLGEVELHHVYLPLVLKN